MKTSVISAFALMLGMGVSAAPVLAEEAVVMPATPVVINGITISEHDYPYVKARCEELYRASLDDQSAADSAKPEDPETQNGGDDQNGGDQNGGDQNQTTSDDDQGDTAKPQGVDEAVTTFDLSTLTLEICKAAGLVDTP